MKSQITETPDNKDTVASIVVIACLFLLVIWSISVWADAITLYPTDDATIRSGNPNTNSGSVPVLTAQACYVEDFNDGIADGFSSATGGSWSVQNGMYVQSANSGGVYVYVVGSAAICKDCTIRISAKTLSAPSLNNSFIFFDYVGGVGAKVAGFDFATNSWFIGDVTASAVNKRVTTPANLQANTFYAFDVKIDSAAATASILVNGSTVLSYTYSSISSTRVGVGTFNRQQAYFDDLKVVGGNQSFDGCGVDRSLIRFSQTEISSAIGIGSLSSAKLRLYLENSILAESPGENIQIRRLSGDWNQNAVTWNCGIDSNPGNSQMDCSQNWNGGTTVSGTTTSEFQVYGQAGWVEFDVTADVNSFLTQGSNFGWQLKRQHDYAAALIQYISKEGTQANRPQLVLVVAPPPTITATISPSPGPAGWNNSNTTVTFTCSDSESGIASCTSPVTITSEGPNQQVSGTAVNNAGGHAGSTVSLSIDKTRPFLSINTPANGATVYTASLSVTGTVSDTLSGLVSITCNGANAQLSGLNYSCSAGLNVGANTVFVVATDVAGNQAEASIALTYDNSLPPDPATVAPEIDPTVATNIAESSAFLYTGSNPIQTGVQTGTIEAKRAAVIRGKVITSDGTALPGVAISVLDHPEFGSTMSRADGMYDLVVNGGGTLNLVFEKTGYITSQRSLDAAWEQFETVDDVAMLPYDSQVSTIDFQAPLETARGSMVTDQDGDRQATLMIPQQVATMVLPNGTEQPLRVMHVRATELTVGSNGPQAMPASLPATSAYTYAVEFSVDEAIAANAKSVHFSTPVSFYVDNFLGFPTGGIVPVGYYDREKAAWIPSDNGTVVQIVSITNGLANIDFTGDGVADNPQSYGVSDLERTSLANLYQPGKSLWRVTVKHFSPYDLNWPKDTGRPPDVDDADDTPLDCPDCEGGSIIEVQNQILRERIGIAGSEFTLNYSSDRVAGFSVANTLRMALSGSILPSGLIRVEVKVSVAGREFFQTFTPAPNLPFTFTWDGRDAYGRPLQGKQPVEITVTNVYQTTYLQPAPTNPSFGVSSSTPLASGNIDSRQELRVERKIFKELGSWQSLQTGLGGWTISPQHYYDSSSKTLYYGDGHKRTAETTGLILSNVAGTPKMPPSSSELNIDGQQATNIKIGSPTGVAMDSKGNLYFSDPQKSRVLKVSPNGIITTAAGVAGICDYSGDGGPATSAHICNPEGLDFAPDQSLYIAEDERIRRVDQNGVITTIAGGGNFWGYNISATELELFGPTDVAVAQDGTFYIVDSDEIWRVSPDGNTNPMTTCSFDGPGLDPADGIPLTDTCLFELVSIDVDSFGNLYLAMRDHIWKVTTDGILHIVAGGGSNNCDSNVDGLPATSVLLSRVRDVSVAEDGTVYFTEWGGAFRVFQISPAGIIKTAAGRGSSGCNTPYTGQNGPAPKAMLCVPWGVTTAPNGKIYVSDLGNYVVDSLSTVFPEASTGEAVIAEEDGSQLYVFDSVGRHLRTVDALTGVTIYQFGYTNGTLSQITDRNGNVTYIQHDSSGKPTAITAPFGQNTTLSVDGNDYLNSIMNPAGDDVQFVNSSTGLLSSMIDANNHQHTFTYDSQGRLTLDQNPGGGFSQLSRVDQSLKASIVTLTTAMNRVNQHFTEQLSSGQQHRANTDASGLVTNITIDSDQSQTVTSPDGTIATTTIAGDPRFGLQAPVTSTLKITTPAGLISNVSESKTVQLSDPLNLLSLVTLTSTKTINGRNYTSVFDAATRTLTSASPVGRQTVTTLDSLGRLGQMNVANFAPSSFSYDPQGRISQITSTDGTETRTYSFTYNAAGFLETLTDPMQRVASFQYDAVGRVLMQQLTDGRQIHYTYDANGNLLSVSPPSYPAHVFTYTPVDLMNTYDPPDVFSGSDQITYSYNTDKQVTQVSRPDGTNITIGYDTGGRLLTITTSRGTTSLVYHATKGTLTSLTAPGGVGLSFTYDGSLLKSATWSGPVAGSVSWNLDVNFRITSESVNSANAISFTYDNDSLPTQVGALTITRNLQNGVISGTTLGVVTDTRSYSSFGEITAYSEPNLYSTQYTRDKLGRITHKTETVQGVTDNYDYIYDTAGRLTDVSKNSVAVAHFDFDSNSNRLPGAYDAQDRLLQSGNLAFTYTASGELQTKTDTSTSQTTTYTYDELDNLTSATLPNGTLVEYIIDGANRRVGKKINGTKVQGFLYRSKLQIIAELGSTNNVVSRFVYGTRANVPDYMIKAGVTYRIISDHLGSPRLVVNSTTGAVAQRIDYDDFGNVTSDSNPGFQPFGFAGGLYDRDTKLIRFGVRDYDPQTGRWTAKDPIRFAGGDSNLYGYVLNDPVNFIDPRGLQEITPFPTGGPGLPPSLLPGAVKAAEELASAVAAVAETTGGAALAPFVIAAGLIVGLPSEISTQSEYVHCSGKRTSNEKYIKKKFEIGEQDFYDWIHDIKKDIGGSRGNLTFDPETGDAYDQNGDWVGNVNDAKQ